MPEVMKRVLRVDVEAAAITQEFGERPPEIAIPLLCAVLKEGVVVLREPILRGPAHDVERQERKLRIAAAEVDEAGRGLYLGDADGLGHGSLIPDSGGFLNGLRNAAWGLACCGSCGPAGPGGFPLSVRLLRCGRAVEAMVGGPAPSWCGVRMGEMAAGSLPRGTDMGDTRLMLARPNAALRERGSNEVQFPVCRGFSTQRTRGGNEDRGQTMVGQEPTTLLTWPLPAWQGLRPVACPCLVGPWNDRQDLPLQQNTLQGLRRQGWAMGGPKPPRPNAALREGAMHARGKQRGTILGSTGGS